MASATLVAMVLLPLAEIVARGVFHTGVPGSGIIERHFTLWVCFLGSALAARDGRLLSFASGGFLKNERLQRAASVFSAFMAAGVAALLCRAGIDLVSVEKGAGTVVAVGIPVWVALLVVPISFGLIALRMAWRVDERWPLRAVVLAGAALGAFVASQYPLLEGRAGWPGVVLVLAATLVGGPIFAALGGVTALLFMRDGVPPTAVLAETYRMAVNPTLPALPLFTLVGFLLAEGDAASRLLRFFRAFFGWIPGGTALVCTLLCAFFTIPTGGSGVTILALGALLLQALRKDNYRDRFSLGLLTGSGSLGLLFPPAVPLILYGIVAQISIEDLFIAGILPGVVLVLLVSAWGIREGLSTGVQRTSFRWDEARGALWEAKWELMLPLVALGAIFSGYATLVEASAVTALYAFFTQFFVHRDLRLSELLPKVLVPCMVLIGGVLLILGVAMGFSSYMVDAQVPARALEWVRTYIHSPFTFLLCLNLFLLVVGCLMDIFSATVVVVPLIAPLGIAFGIHPVHLGIIFVANLELGYITPPVGLNLFFASYRFEQPLLKMYRAALPFLVILGIGVIIITYVPLLSMGLLRLLGRT